jgi:hypothetical protein
MEVIRVEKLSLFLNECCQNPLDQFGSGSKRYRGINCSDAFGWEWAAYEQALYLHIFRGSVKCTAFRKRCKVSPNCLVKQLPPCYFHGETIQECTYGNPIQ